MRKFESDQRAYRFGHDDAQRDADGKFQISIQREQNHKNQDDRQGANEGKLRLRLQELAVLAAPFQAVALRQGDGFADRGLTIAHRALKIATFDGILHADVAGIVFAVDERRAISLLDAGQLAERKLLAIGRAHQQVANFLGAAAELRLHAYYEVEELFALDHLGGGLSAHRRLHYRLNIGHVDSVTRDLVAVHINQQAGLSQFAHHRQFRKARHSGEHVLDLDGPILQHIQIVA